MTTHFISSENTETMSLDELANQFKMIQSGEKRIAIIGTRNLPIIHQQIIETLSYALAQARNTIVTSGGISGVNSAVIRGAMKADPNLLEVILPQTLNEQNAEIHSLLKNLKILIEHPERLSMDFVEASRICYNEIVSSAHQVISFVYHDSRTILQAVEYAKLSKKIVTEFFLD